MNMIILLSLYLIGDAAKPQFLILFPGNFHCDCDSPGRFEEDEIVIGILLIGFNPPFRFVADFYFT